MTPLDDDLVPVPGRPLQFKQSGLIAELFRSDLRLQTVVYFAAAYSLTHFGRSLIVTRVEATRSGIEGIYGADSKLSVHEVRPCRGADCRTHGWLDDSEVSRLVQAINIRFAYRADATLQVALHETVDVMTRLGRLNPTPADVHLHLQVPPAPVGVSQGIIRLWA